MQSSITLYEKQFITYNVHSLLHLPQDYGNHGSLENIAAFPFESYLGLLKSSIKSGYKPFNQVANFAHQQNASALKECGNRDVIFQLYNGKDQPAIVGRIVTSTGKKSVHYRNCCKNGCQIIRLSATDGIISWKQQVYFVVDILVGGEKAYFAGKKYDSGDLFSHPLSSRTVGIFRLSNFERSITYIPVTIEVKKCMLLSYKNSKVAIILLHNNA